MRSRTLLFTFVAPAVLIAIAACATTRGDKAYELNEKLKELAHDGKCAKALKAFDELKGYREYPFVHNALAMAVTDYDTVGTEDRSFTRCLVDAGRHQEVVDMFDATCFGKSTSYVTAQYQSFICTEYKFRAADRAFKLAGRQNPLAESAGALAAIEQNSRQMSELDTAISNIYVRRVTAHTGTSDETLEYYEQMRDATAEAIVFLEAQLPRCEQASSALCAKSIHEKRQEKARELAKYNQEIAEIQEDQAGAQRIAEAAPAILGAVGSVGAAIAGSGDDSPVAAPTPQVGDGSGASAGAFDGSSWLFDDRDHGPCVSVEAVPNRSESALAYGRYLLKNQCVYKLKLLLCVNVDRSDGTSSPTFDSHQMGAACPGGGWGGTELEGSQTKEQRTWFPYNRIRADIMACREGWSFVQANGDVLPANSLVGKAYRCRKLRSDP